MLIWGGLNEPSYRSRIPTIDLRMESDTMNMEYEEDEEMQASKMNNDEVKNMKLENIENMKIMNASEMNVNAEYVFRTKLDDFEQIIGMDLEGNVLYTRIEYPMCVEEIMMEMGA